VSNALKRLRLQFDDVLFVKTATGMEPTPRAAGIATLLDEGFASIRLAVSRLSLIRRRSVGGFMEYSYRE
jgi:DNA-binding transcriptional LysR family regulator